MHRIFYDFRRGTSAIIARSLLVCKCAYYCDYASGSLESVFYSWSRWILCVFTKYYGKISEEKYYTWLFNIGNEGSGAARHLRTS
jgi:hypothetical protein